MATKDLCKRVERTNAQFAPAGFDAEQKFMVNKGGLSMFYKNLPEQWAKRAGFTLIEMLVAIFNVGE